MKRVKVPRYGKRIARGIFKYWIGQLKKMQVFKGKTFIQEAPVHDSDCNNVSKTSRQALSGIAEQPVANIVESFFWPRPSAATYQRYRDQFSF